MEVGVIDWDHVLKILWCMFMSPLHVDVAGAVSSE